MNGFLVVLRHTMDDLPVALFDNWEAALEYAMAIKGMPCNWDREVFNTDCSTPCAVAIATFKNSFVAQFDIVRTLDDDDDEDDDEPTPVTPRPDASVLAH